MHGFRHFLFIQITEKLYTQVFSEYYVSRERSKKEADDTL